MALAMKPAVLYIPYAISYNEHTGNITTFPQFEEGSLVKSKHNVSEDESILASIDDSYTYTDSNDGSISMNDLEDIQYGNYTHPDINAINKYD